MSRVSSFLVILIFPLFMPKVKASISSCRLLPIFPRAVTALPAASTMLARTPRLRALTARRPANSVMPPLSDHAHSTDGAGEVVHQRELLQLR